MNQVVDFFRKLFDTADWPPRWHCGKWSEFHGWFYIISDLLIWSAYFAIPLIILKYISRKSKARFIRAYFLFAAFILACGSTHLLDAITFWYPAYRLNALVRFITGAVSWATVFYMIRIMPQAMTLKTNEELEKEVAERKKVEQELRIANQQLVYAQDIANMGHWQWNVPDNQVSWSAKLCQIFGLPQQHTMTYEQYLEQVHPEDRERINEVVTTAFQTGNFTSFYHRTVPINGQEKIILGKGEVMRDETGAVISMIGTAQDVTEQQKAQQVLQEQAIALEATNEELQRFAYVASHDLQEPLRKILTFASLLQQEARSGFPEKAQLYVDKIVQSTSRMQRLIDDILHFSSIRTNSFDFEPVALQQILEQVLSDLEVSIEQSGAEVRGDQLPTVEANPTQMQQLLQNLLGNAIKFSKPGVRPKVHIAAREVNGAALQREPRFRHYEQQLLQRKQLWPQSRFLLLAITDNGIGFDTNYAGQIFEVFQRLHTNNNYGGTGIGLAICKRIVENHHGAITVDSQVNEGTTFFVLLPFSQEQFR